MIVHVVASQFRQAHEINNKQEAGTVGLESESKVYNYNIVPHDIGFLLTSLGFDPHMTIIRLLTCGYRGLRATSSLIALQNRFPQQTIQC